MDLVRRTLELWLSGDPAFAEAVDPELEWDVSAHPLPDVPNRGRGRDAFVQEVLGTYAEGWIDYSAELREVVDAGRGQVAAVLHETARMRGTEALLDRDLVLLWSVVDGQATFLRVFRTKREALDAASGRL